MSGGDDEFNNGGSTEADMKTLGRYSGNRNDGAGGISGDGTTVVGSYKPNKWGLYDMHGNALEWCLDWYGSSSATGTDPKGPDTGSVRVMRGGNAYETAEHCNSSYRFGNKPSEGPGHYSGFRIACQID